MPKNEKKGKLSISVYVTQVAIYLSPILLYQPLGLMTGMFVEKEYAVIVRSPINLAFFLCVILASIFSVLKLHSSDGFLGNFQPVFHFHQWSANM